MNGPMTSPSVDLVVGPAVMVMVTFPNPNCGVVDWMDASFLMGRVSMMSWVVLSIRLRMPPCMVMVQGICVASAPPMFCMLDCMCVRSVVMSPIWMMGAVISSWLVMLMSIWMLPLPCHSTARVRLSSWTSRWLLDWMREV